MNRSSSIELRRFPATSFPVSPRESLINDAIACGSPYSLRGHLENYDQLRSAERSQRWARFAIGCAGTASALGFGPALLSVIKNCPQIGSKDAQAMCGTNAASAIGAIVGLIGTGISAYTLHMGKVGLSKFIEDKDRELRQRFERVLQPPSVSAHKIMTRYSLLTERDREEVKNDLFAAYLDNPRPVRAEPPTGQPALEIEIAGHTEESSSRA